MRGYQSGRSAQPTQWLECKNCMNKCYQLSCVRARRQRPLRRMLCYAGFVGGAKRAPRMS